MSPTAATIGSLEGGCISESPSASKLAPAAVAVAKTCAARLFPVACDVNEIVEHGFDELRLAPRLVCDAGRDPARQRVARGTIALAHALGLTVIAVGVETDAERVGMRDAGCDYGQGNLFGAARPAGAID